MVFSPGTLLQNTQYQQLTWSGLQVEDKGQRQVIPESNHNYALQYWNPNIIAPPTMSIEETQTTSFDFYGLYYACMWDTSGASYENAITNTTAAEGDRNATERNSYFPAVRCTFTITCDNTRGDVIGPRNLYYAPQQMQSNLMTFHNLVHGAENFRGLKQCYAKVACSPVGKEKTILAIDLLDYTVSTNTGVVEEVS